ncbi:MAG: DUF1656 domain-containing protein [Leptospirillia bacterium]
MKEINFFGIFLSPFLGVALLAFGVLWGLRLLLSRLGFYRHVWHRSLVDLSLYVIILEILVLLARRHSP